MKTKMASDAGMKDFYKQKKKTPLQSGVAKLSGAVHKKKQPTSKPPISPTASIQSDITAHSLLSEWPDNSTEEVLEQFDMDMKYGPCLGITRLMRWERAECLGLSPPAEVGALLRDGSTVKSDCLWEGRI
ncbi:polymerase delta 4 [Wolffia australiana]